MSLRSRILLFKTSDCLKAGMRRSPCFLSLDELKEVAVEVERYPAGRGRFVEIVRGQSLPQSKKSRKKTGYTIVRLASQRGNGQNNLRIVRYRSGVVIWPMGRRLTIEEYENILAGLLADYLIYHTRWRGGGSQGRIRLASSVYRALYEKFLAETSYMSRIKKRPADGKHNINLYMSTKGDKTPNKTPLGYRE